MWPIYHLRKDPLIYIRKYHDITWDNKASLTIYEDTFPDVSNDTGQESFTLNPNNFTVLKITNILVEISFVNENAFQ